jgi:hypothetical protein
MVRKCTFSMLHYYRVLTCASQDCCLDVDWLTEDTFASCGADKRINVMKLGVDEPVKVFEYV